MGATVRTPTAYTSERSAPLKIPLAGGYCARRNFRGWRATPRRIRRKPSIVRTRAACFFCKVFFMANSVIDSITYRKPYFLKVIIVLFNISKPYQFLSKKEAVHDFLIKSRTASSFSRRSDGCAPFFEAFRRQKLPFCLTHK